MVSRLALLLCLLGLASSSFAQIPNPSFENWTGGDPDGWLTTNVPGVAVPVTQAQPGFVGTSALRGEVVPYFEILAYPPFVTAIFPVNDRPAALTGAYVFNPVAGDSLIITVIFFDSTLGFGAGAGVLIPPPTGSAYQNFTVPIEYVDGFTVPDTCIIQITIANETSGSVSVGSTMLIDNLAFSATPTSVGAVMEVPERFSLTQNYPNPFNPSTTIQYSLPEAGRATLTVANLLGETVATLVDATHAAGSYNVTFDAAGLPSGMYFYTLRAGGLVETRRMMLLR